MVDQIYKIPTKLQEWRSLNTIIENLSSTYQEEYQMSESVNDAGILLSICNTPEEIKAYLKQFKDERVIIHLHGDFIENLVEWNSLFLKFPEKKFQLLASSHSQAKIIEKILKTKCRVCTPIPYTLSSKELSSRTKQKFVYYGRLSENKNIDWLIKLFKKFQSITNRQDRLDIYGIPDNISCFVKNMSRLQRPLIEEIIDLAKNEPNINIYPTNHSSRVLENYDHFISLSTYHDDDFGVGIIEAINTGLNPILSNWGGLRDINRNLNKDGIDLKLVGDLVTPITSSFYKNLLKNLDLNIKNSIMVESKIPNLAFESFLEVTSIETRYLNFSRALSEGKPINYSVNHHETYKDIYNGPYISPED
ncbi:MAG: hypothetical protein CME65_11560 [Halobacteriovoraceae bacterium]|nr:hypothetical protein [Halobacteriovoraceae bacterium]|tara:strand:- start:27800 stop:28888 length:1089 start_codon:yes stop_codon:yes gene_type:complete